ncbi:SDR family oxidoreductase [Amycolatopsis sp. K13G38]|uniref:SDR family oxidoreductase n=1 Tax=Amycolatopsis acididurans TaxID=2724524 RepID=A0ABX1JHK1_9PSEU|nr:SDR family oxidoreductase [Amycolatopsis acididurans]NKQ58036.1 SDR family oxidoreductase [Amycolatopsis acididurans]
MTSDTPVVLVTGAGRGIGAAIARRLGRDGHHVLVADLDRTTATEVATEIGGTPEVLDVTDAEAAKALAARTPRLDAIVNNAGIYPVTPMDTVDPTVFRAVLDVNVVGPLILTQAFLPQLTAADNASVVNIASIAATTPTIGMGAYSPSKAALVSLTKVCAVEFAGRRIRFNAIAPGGVRTEGSQEALTSGSERDLRYEAVVPARRRALPADIADAVPFFLSRDSRYVTGQVLAVDGGLTQGTLDYLRAYQNH